MRNPSLFRKSSIIAINNLHTRKLWAAGVLLGMLLLFVSTEASACHRGGPMGFASKDSSGLTVDITSAPTSSSSSTSGGMGCKDWEFSFVERTHFLQAQWEVLSEEASQGQGQQLAAFSQIMGCPVPKHAQFGSLMQTHYSDLFITPDETNAQQQSHALLLKLETLLKQHTELECTV